MMAPIDGHKLCPRCGGQTIWAYIEDGGMGDWCPQCKQSLQYREEGYKLAITKELMVDALIFSCKLAPLFIVSIMGADIAACFAGDQIRPDWGLLFIVLFSWILCFGLRILEKL